MQPLSFTMDLGQIPVELVYTLEAYGYDIITQ